MDSSSDRQVLLLFAGNTRFDSRSSTVIAALQQAGFHVLIGPPMELTGQGSRFFFRWIPWLMRNLEYIRSENPVHLVCMDIFSVPLAFISGRTFLFDAREINAHVHAFSRSVFKRWWWGWWESWSFRHAVGVTTVNQSLKKWFISNYRTEPVIFLNIPIIRPMVPGEITRSTFGLPEACFIWVYQGGIQAGRGVEHLVEWIHQRPREEHLLLIGPFSGMPELESRCKTSDRITTTGPIPQDQLLAATRLGNAGLMLIETISTSYRLSLPNKFFEYILSGLPVISSDLPEPASYLNRLNCGLICKDLTQLNDCADQMRLHYADYQTGVVRLATEIRGFDQTGELATWFSTVLTSTVESRI